MADKNPHCLTKKEKFPSHNFLCCLTKMYEGVFLTGIQDSLHRLIYKPYLCNPQAQRNSR